MKKYTVQDVNHELGKQGFVFRVIGRCHSVGFLTSKWIASAGPVFLPTMDGNIYVDSNFYRFIRLENGQIFRCTDTDLKALPEREQITLKAYYTDTIN